METSQYTYLRALRGLLVFWILFCMHGCNRPNLFEEPLPVQKLPKLNNVVAFNRKHEFFYDSKDFVNRINIINNYQSEDEFSTYYTLTYNSSGRLVKVLGQEESGTVRETNYFYDKTSLVKTEEYSNKILTRTIAYTFNPAGQLVEKTRKVAQPNDQEPETLKYVYVYDAQGNLTQETSYSPGKTPEDWTVYQTVLYRKYDDKPYVEQMMKYPLLPHVIMHRNNPQEIIVKGGWYSYLITNAYEYNDKGWPIKRVIGGTEKLLFSYY